MVTTPAIESTTQLYLDIHDITNDVLILKNGATSLVMTVSAMNFGLLAEPEQDAIMYSYAGLLNSLNYPVQIVVRSQTKDVTSYLKLLEEEEDKAADEIKKGWINRYRNFVTDLIKQRNVLDKKFYVVVSATPLEMGLLPPSTVIPGAKQTDLSTVERSVILEKAKEILEPRRDHLLSQLARIGLAGRQLATQEIIQLFYLSYNPEAAEGQQITDTNSYTTPLVQASVQGGIMADPTSTPPTPAPAMDNAAPTQDSPVAPAAAPTPPTPPAPAMDTPTPAPVTPPMTPPEASMTPPPTTGTPTPPATPPVMATPPSITPPSDGGATPPAAPTMTTPTPAPAMDNAAPATDTPSEESAAQDAINSTLQQLGGAPAVPPAATPAPTSTATPATPPAPAGATAVPPVTPPTVAGSAPSTPPTPPATGTPAQAGGTPSGTGNDDLPPLPEI